MTYIKWKDEVEGYLISLPAEEKQQIFSYFSEMYADKRDAGKSEAQIIEEFGAPYDVAKRILEGSKDSSPAGGEGAATGTAGAAKVSGGNNYNYNYYNYNYGGAPQPPTGLAKSADKAEQQPSPTQAQPTQAQPTPQVTPTPTKEIFAEGVPASVIDGGNGAKHRDAGHTVLGIIFILCLIPLSVFLIGAPLSVIIQGFIETSSSLGAIVAANGDVGAFVANAGIGLIEVGLGFTLLAPFTLLTKFLWKKLTAYMRG